MWRTGCIIIFLLPPCHCNLRSHTQLPEKIIHRFPCIQAFQRLGCWLCLLPTARVTAFTFTSTSSHKCLSTLSHCSPCFHNLPPILLAISYLLTCPPYQSSQGAALTMFGFFLQSTQLAHINPQSFPWKSAQWLQSCCIICISLAFKSSQNLCYLLPFLCGDS